MRWKLQVSKVGYSSIHQVKAEICYKQFACLPNCVWLGQIACPAGDQTGLGNLIEFRAQESDRGRFGYLFCQQIIFLASKSAGQQTYRPVDMMAGVKRST